MKRLLPILIGTALVIMSGCTEESLSVDQSNNEVSAHHVPVEKAKQRLLRIASELNNETGTRAGGGIAGITSPITSVATLGRDQQRLTRGEESEAAYYVFRFGDNEGFAIMAADDRLPEMMAIASGTPNQDDPAADLPDTTFWQVPDIGDINGGLDSAINTQNPDIHEPNEPGRPYTRLLAIDQIPVHWGQRAPFNALLNSSWLPDTIDELRLPTAAVAVAQLLTRKEYRNTLIIEDGLSHEFDPDTIRLNELRKLLYAESFDGRPDMALNVAKLFRYLEQQHLLYYQFYVDMFTVGYDNVNHVRYIEGQLPYWVGSSPAYNVIGPALSYMGFRAELIDNIAQPYHVSLIYSALNDGASVIVGGYEYLEPASLVHNVMWYDDNPSEKYFLVNKCRGFNGDGYYLAKTVQVKSFYKVTKYNK